ncbi:MAG TPA: hypothetical protein VFY65_01920 [Longimicrobium sp.]|nr:hypothetical protein [Longimicrobium sp.]
MRVRVRRYPSPQRDPGLEAADDSPAPGTLEEVDVPAGPFALIGAIAGLIPTLLTLLTFWLKDKPDAEIKRGMDVNQAQVTILSKAMEVEDARGREVSFQLLSAMGLLKPGDRARVDSLLAADSLPRWRAEGSADDGEATADTARTGTGGNPEVDPEAP